MARGDDMMASFRGDEDPASPTTQVFKAMQARGLPLNAGNIRRFMEQLRSSPAQPGDKPDFESGDDKGNRQSLTVERGSDDVAGKIEGQGQRGNAGNTQTPSGPVDRRDDTDTGSKTTSAQPTSSNQPPVTSDALPGDSDYSLGSSGLGGLILGGLPLAYGAYKGMTGGGVAAGGGGAPTIDLSGAGGAPLQLSGPAPNVSPMESAMLKATAPNTGVPLLGAPPPAPPIAMPDQTSGPTIPMPPPEPPSSVGGGVAQARPNVTVQTQPQLSGEPPPVDFVRPRPSMPFRPNSAEFNALVHGLARNAGRLVR